MEVIRRKLHRKRATGVVLPDLCGSGFFYNTWIIQHKLKKYMPLLMNKSTPKRVNNITAWSILRRKHPWACIRHLWYLIPWYALCTYGRWCTCACCAPIQRGAAPLDDSDRFKRVFNNLYSWELYKLHMIFEALNALFNVIWTNKRMFEQFQGIMKERESQKNETVFELLAKNCRKLSENQCLLKWLPVIG